MQFHTYMYASKKRKSALTLNSFFLDSIKMFFWATSTLSRASVRFNWAEISVMPTKLHAIHNLRKLTARPLWQSEHLMEVMNSVLVANEIL